MTNRDPQQHAVEAFAFMKAMTFGIWTAEIPMYLINYIAKKQAKYAIEEAVDYITDRCYELCDDENLDISTVLAKHDGFQYYEQVIAWLDQIDDMTGEFYDK